MDFGHTVTVPADQLREIFARLQPHLPSYLKKVDAHTSGYGLAFEFAPFTGREPEPTRPDGYWDDPQLKYVREDFDAAEHQLRERARQILDEVYHQAHELWRDAAYVAELKLVVRDAPDRWKAYERELKALESAYAYLGTAQAGTEWPAAVFRLVDAQSRTTAAAVAFDERAQAIADVHQKHRHAGLGHDTALKAAGYPQAKDWHIAPADDYGCTYYSDLDTGVPVEIRVRRLIKQQDSHIAKVGRLSGATV